MRSDVLIATLFVVFAIGIVIWRTWWQQGKTNTPPVAATTTKKEGGKSLLLLLKGVFVGSQQKYIIGLLVAFLLVWPVIGWFFPSLKGLATNPKLWLGGVILLGVIAFAKPKWAAWTVCLFLFFLTLNGIKTTVITEGYFIPPEEEVTGRGNVEADNKTSDDLPPYTVRLRDDKEVEIIIPYSLEIIDTNVYPPAETVQVRTEYGRTFTDGEGIKVDLPQVNGKVNRRWWIKPTEGSKAKTYEVVTK